MSSDLLQTVVARIASARAPVGYSALKEALVRKKTGITEESLREALQIGLQEDRIFRWGDYGRSKQCYWHTTRDRFLAEAVAGQLGERARKRSEIKIGGFPDKAVQSQVTELIGSGKLKRYPGIGGERERIGSSDDSYRAAILDFVAAKWKRAGLDPAALRFDERPSPGKDWEPRVLEALRRLEPEPDIPVSTVRLRGELRVTADDKIRFDRALLALQQRGVVYLSAHDNPSNLPPADREELIDSGFGTYYVAAALRSSQGHAS